MDSDGKPLTSPVDDARTDGEEDEDKEECGWCRWMNAGGCKAQFQVWLDCVDAVKASGRDDVESCASIMGPLWECMERHRDYYAPQLDSLAERRKTADAGDAEGEDMEKEEPTSGQPLEGGAQGGTEAGAEGKVSGTATSSGNQG